MALQSAGELGFGKECLHAIAFEIILSQSTGQNAFEPLTFVIGSKV